jgi:preprotein translocase subunit SecG
MEIVLRVLQVFLAVGLIGVVLLQRSEGGGLGLGSGGGAGSFMSVRGTANFLTRVTAILAALFMVTCLVLALLAKPSGAPKSIFDTPAPAPVSAPAPAEAPAPQAPSPEPAAQAPALPVPVPGEQPNAGVTTNPLQPAPTPAAQPAPVPATPPAASAPAEPAPVAPAQQPAPQPEKKAKKAKQAHPSGQ